MSVGGVLIEFWIRRKPASAVWKLIWKGRMRVVPRVGDEVNIRRDFGAERVHEVLIRLPVEDQREESVRVLLVGDDRHNQYLALGDNENE